VDDDGNADYTEIQAAVDAASPGDTIRVAPGSYNGGSGPYVVTLDKNVSLIAPNGATISGEGGPAGLRPGAIEIAGSAAPTVEGFTVTRVDQTPIRVSETDGSWTIREVSIEYCRASSVAILATDTTGDWELHDISISKNRSASPMQSCPTLSTGVDASNSDGNWVLDGVTVPGATFVGLSARGGTGAWAIRNATVRNTDIGIVASQNTGDWIIESSIVTEQERNYGIQVANTTGDWTIRDTVVKNESIDRRFAGTGIYITEATGHWTLENVTIRDQLVGAGIVGSTGDWSIVNSTFEDVDGGGIDIVDPAGDWSITDSTITDSPSGIEVENATGAWEVTENSITEHRSQQEVGGLIVNGSTATGDATCNWWGASDGPSGDFDGSGDKVTGNVQVEPYYTDAAMTTPSGEGCTEMADEPSTAERYDSNGNNRIDIGEVRVGINDFSSGELGIQEVRQLINLWSSSEGV
jgi:hypothetical protein